ncbi:MAG: YfhO family protein [Anaerolineae bacterium]|nr:YfhO family protein [Anaerolineae bacterium]
MRRKLLDIGLIILLMALGFLFFGALLQPEESEILIGTDLYWLFYPLTEFSFSALQAGHFPLWNPNLFLGFPHYAEPQLSTFYPLMWLFSRWTVAKTAVWLYAFHLGLAAAGGYVLIRQLGGRWSGAFIGGLTLGFSAFMTTHIYAGHLPHVMTIAYLPWLLAAAHWAVKKRAWLPTIAATMVAAVPLALAMLAGYAPFFPFLVAAVTIYMFWLAALAWHDNGWHDTARILLQWLGLGLFSGMLAAVQLLPTVEFAQLSSRVANADYEFASQLSMPVWQLLTLLTPDIFGMPNWHELPLTQAEYWAVGASPLYWEGAIYVGVLPLILWGLSWFFGKRDWYFWGILGVVGLLLAFGPEGILHRIFYQVIPGFGLFRVPARFSYFFVLSTAVLSGLMFDHWFDLPEDTFQLWQARLRKFMVLSLTVLGGLVVLAVMWLAVQLDPEIQLRVQGVLTQLVRLAFLLAISIGLLTFGKGHSRWLLVLIASVIILVDLWGFSSKFLQTIDIERRNAWAQADEVLPDERYSYRVYSSGLRMNLASLYDFQHVAGYDDFQIEAAMKFRELIHRDARIAQLLGVTYHLYDPDIGSILEAQEGWRYFMTLDGVTIFEQVDALPRAFLVHDVIGAIDEEESLALISQPELDFRETAVVQVQPDSQCDIDSGVEADSHVEITAYEPEAVIIQVETDATGWLVLADMNYPGWKAKVNGRSVPIQATNYALRGICVPAGTHEVIFTFEPPLFFIGSLLSLTALFLLLGTLLVFVIDTKRKAANQQK